jgi:hypothetical protein
MVDVSSESLADLADLADVNGKKYLKIWGWMGMDVEFLQL